MVNSLSNQVVWLKISDIDLLISALIPIAHQLVSQ
jgi:hypothetical protein